MSARSERELPTIRESVVRMARTAILLRSYWSKYAGLVGLGLLLGAIGLVGPLLTKRERAAEVINLSLATRLQDAIAPLFEACEAARKDGIVIVAAAHNGRVPAVPAYLEPVLSVEEGRQTELLHFDFESGEPIECRAAGAGVPVVDGAGGVYRRGGSSIAAATVSGLVARLREVSPAADLDQVRLLLHELTLNQEVHS